MKAWSDTQKHGYKGVLLTRLVANHFGVAQDSDDQALATNVKSAILTLQAGLPIPMPIMPHDDLLAGWSDSERGSLIENLQELADTADEALNAVKLSEATEFWSEAFGDRFPLVKEDNENGTRAAAAGTTIVRPTKVWASSGLD